MQPSLAPPGEIRQYYNRLMHEVSGGYVQRRWGDSPIKRSHYRQTWRALAGALHPERHRTADRQRRDSLVAFDGGDFECAAEAQEAAEIEPRNRSSGCALLSRPGANL